MANKQTVPMQLPFAPQQGWKVFQGNNGTVSHIDGNAFCWDFALPKGSSMGHPVYASAAGEVVDLHPTEGWFYVKHAEGEFCAYLHCIPNSLKFKLGDRVQMGQELAQVGNTAPGENLAPHLHIALSNVVGLLPYGSTPNFTTIPAEFMEYDVFNAATSSWDFVPFGVPQEGQIVVRRSRWGAWTPLGAKFPAMARPTVVSRKPNIIDILMRGMDNRLWQLSWVGGASPSWSNWMPHDDGFVLNSDPVVDSMAPNHLHVFALGTNRQLWQKWYIDGKGWSGWMLHGGEFSEMSSAGVVSRQPTITDIVMRGMDNRMWQKSFVGGGNPPWTGWMPHKDGFALGSDPAAVSTGPNHLGVLALGTDRQLWLKQWVQ
jgi:hypothetical protein